MHTSAPQHRRCAQKTARQMAAPKIPPQTSRDTRYTQTCRCPADKTSETALPRGCQKYKSRTTRSSSRETTPQKHTPPTNPPPPPPPPHPPPTPPPRSRVLRLPRLSLSRAQTPRHTNPPLPYRADCYRSIKAATAPIPLNW